MKLLLIHSDFIEYEVKKKVGKIAEDISDEMKTGSMEEALTAFIAVETPDEADQAGAVAQAAAEIRKIATEVKTDRVMLYPYAHLSSDLASPSVAVDVLKSLESELTGDFEVKRSPFGWYKAFKISCKGHPLSELSRHVLPDGSSPARPVAKANTGKDASMAAPKTTTAERPEQESDAIKAEKKLTSTWYVFTPEGELVEADQFDFKQHPGLKKFYEYEAKGTRTGGKEPPHIQAMQDLELVDYEPGSDPGNFRWYPKGQLVKRLLESHVGNICRGHGGMQVETPIMYDYQHPALSKYLQRFPARQYVVQSEDKEFFLRFAACFGQYLIAHDATISYKHLPLRLFELTHYSFRREQRGELAGLRRLRTFTMPDMHTLVADMEQAKDEFLEHFQLSMGWMKDLDFEYEAGVRFVRSFFDENRDFAKKLANTLGRPLLIEMWDDRFFYFVMKFEFNVNDATDKAAALSTVQIDVENAERFDITYTNDQGKETNPYILHTSVSGSIDRCLYAMLETQLQRGAKGIKASLPFWLAPTQVRLLSVSEGHVAACEELAATIEEHARAAGTHIRVDIDDRDEGIGRKIRDAEKEWSPLIVVVGDKEAEAKAFKPRYRTPTIQAAFAGEEVDIQGLVKGCVALMRGYPTGDLPLPQHVSKRPTFR